MIKQMEMTGKNQEDAIARALDKLGMDRDDVSVEVLELGKTGFLGIGSVPAKVRLTYEVPDEAPPAPPSVPQEAPRAVPSDAPKAARPQKQAQAAKEVSTGAPVEEKPAPAPAREKKPAPAPVKEKKPAPAPAKEKKAAAAAPAKEEKPAAAAPDEGVEEQVTAFLTGLLERMDARAALKITRDGDTYDVVLEGEELGSLIGRRGETLDAIQQLTGYVVNRGRSKRVRIHVDAENYRARREESLRRLANKVAGKVVRCRRSVTLETMNAYERHVIHAALQDYRGVNTHSVGVEPNRRVVITYSPEK